jgi:hypothetical protein
MARSPPAFISNDTLVRISNGSMKTAFWEGISSRLDSLKSVQDVACLAVIVVLAIEEFLEDYTTRILIIAASKEKWLQMIFGCPIL